MRTLILSAAVIFASAGLHAQNQNVTEVQKTTVRTVKDSEGERKYEKTQDVKAVQNIEFQNAESNALNKNLKDTPVEVVSTTSVKNPDGSTRTVDMDRSALYTLDGKVYQLSLDPAGYVITTDNNKRLGILRATSTNSYIYRGKNQTSVGYFDTNGNLVVETYDDKSDKVSVQTYTRN